MFGSGGEKKKKTMSLSVKIERGFNELFMSMNRVLEKIRRLLGLFHSLIHYDEHLVRHEN